MNEKDWWARDLAARQAQAARIRQGNRTNPKGEVGLPGEMLHPNYQQYLNEALLEGKPLLDAHVHARKLINKERTAEYARACNAMYDEKFGDGSNHDK